MPFKVLSFRALVSLVSLLILFATIFSVAGTNAVSATRSVGLAPTIVTEAGDQLLLVKDKKTKEFSCKKAKCDPGEVKLDKPNIYGACCQTGTAPLTPKTKPAEPEKCKFPGEVGTPPNCTCPANTEFLGYKGCVKVRFPSVCTGNKPSQAAEEYWAVQKKDCKGTFTCSPKGDLKECCCTEKVYDE